jgi:hypothetical protein
MGDGDAGYSYIIRVSDVEDRGGLGNDINTWSLSARFRNKYMVKAWARRGSRLNQGKRTPSTRRPKIRMQGKDIYMLRRRCLAVPSWIDI